MRNNRGNFWWIFFLIIILGSGGFVPFLVILAIIFGLIAWGVNEDKKRSGSRTTTTYRRETRSTSARINGKLSPSEVAKINVYFRKYFRTNDSLEVNGYVLALQSDSYSSLRSLDVFKDNHLVSTFSDFANAHPRLAEGIRQELAHLSAMEGTNSDVIDVEVTEHKEPEKKTEKKVDERAQKFIDEINNNNVDITDEEITNSLHETTALLRQIQQLENEFPDSKSKLDKLYEYYLPILTRILRQYSRLQNAKYDPSYVDTQDKLTRTIALINDAMRSIITSMTDQDFINLSADISTLEAVLQKDGYTKSSQMYMGQSEDD